MSDNLKTMIRGTVRLHRLIEAGQGDSDEAEALRESTDVPWYVLTEDEKEIVRFLGEMLSKSHSDQGIVGAT